MRTCPQCLSEFAPTRTGHVYCSDRCRELTRGASRRKEFPARACDRCGGRYVPTRQASRWCSERCGWRGRNAEKQARTREGRGPVQCAECATAIPDAGRYDRKYCAECRPIVNRRNAQRSHLQLTYGMTPEDYAERLEAQGHRCAICGTTEPRGKAADVFKVDHCHETGAVRGLLCDQCNRGLGFLGDDPDRLMAGVAYLLQHTNVLEAAHG